MKKKILKSFFIKSGANYILRMLNRTPRVLFWHGVDIDPDPIVEAESINKDDFIKHVEYLEKHYEIISIDEFYIRFKDNKFNGKEIVLTFDDGYKNNITVLAPILKERKLPFTVFICASNITNGDLFATSILRLAVYGSSLKKLNIPFLNKEFSILTLEDKNYSHKVINEYLKESPLKEVEIIRKELISNLDSEKWGEIINRYNSVKPLTWDEVKELQSYECTIGSHCIDHICCHSNQEEDELKKQIVKSKKIIESQLGISCNYFAYPNGDYTNISNKYVNEAGYLMGFSTKKERVNSTKNNIAALPRIGVPFNKDTFEILINLHPKKWSAF